MPEVPRDPRQLARDILSGKISIEDLAREQQRRRAAAGGGNAPPPVPARPVPPPVRAVAVPRPAPPLQRPVARQPAFPQQRPLQRPAQRFAQTQQNQQRPLPMPAQQISRQPMPSAAQSRGPLFDRRPSPALTQPSSAPARASSQGRSRTTNENAYDAPASIQDARKIPVFNKQLNIHSLIRHRTALRQCIIMAEILGKPLALRDEF